MVQLSEKAIKEFKELVLRKRGIELSDQDAQKMAMEWLSFFKLVYKPIEEENGVRRDCTEDKNR